MKSRRLSLKAPAAPFTKSPAALALALPLLLLLLVPALARAQSGSRPPSRVNKGQAPRETRGSSIGVRTRVMQEMEKGAPETRGDKTPALPMGQIAEDFMRLQIVNNRMMAAVLMSESPDYGLIAASTSEIRKRASRIKSNLPLPRPEKDEAAREPYVPPADAAQMKRVLIRFDRALISFVRNPVFRNTDVVNASDGARAGRDLDELIELCRLIGRDAERMKKGSVAKRD